MTIRQVPTTWHNGQEHRRKLAEATNQLISAIQLRGQIALGVSPTLIEDERIGEDSIALLVPADSNAAAASYNIQVTPGTVTINHTGSGSFNYLVIL